MGPYAHVHTHPHTHAPVYTNTHAHTQTKEERGEDPIELAGSSLGKGLGVLGVSP